jgi:hypothetical protein
MAIYQLCDGGHDANGNPRRVTVKFGNGGTIIGKHVDRYDGDGIPHSRDRKGDTVLPDIKITASKYRELKKLSVPEF